MQDVGRIVIVGAGPAGLGAATRLQELGYRSFVVLEAEAQPGGLSASETDAAGFTWDIGSHVFFGADALVTQRIRAWSPSWVTHARHAWVVVDGRWVPYPVQGSAKQLGVAATGPRTPWPAGPVRFDAWLRNEFGMGLFQKFFEPYNEKVWGCALSRLDARAILSRIAPAGTPPDAGGGNAMFEYPGHGTGSVWRAAATGLPVHYGQRVVLVDPDRHVVEVTHGAPEQRSVERYDVVINTMPVDRFVARTLHLSLGTLRAASGLAHSGVLVVGFGLVGSPPPILEGVHWWYDPDPRVPYHRASVLSDYAPAMAPPGYWSVLVEVNHGHGRHPPAFVARDCVEALAERGILNPHDVVSTWQRLVPYAYPTPTVDRDERLAAIAPQLAEQRLVSIGRFGAWRYEQGNMDQCLRQGMDAVDRLLGA